MLDDYELAEEKSVEEKKKLKNFQINLTVIGFVLILIVTPLIGDPFLEIMLNKAYALDVSCGADGWQEMEIEAKWDTDGTTFNDIVNSFQDGEEKYGYELNVRWQGKPRKYVDDYYDKADALFDDLHMLRHRIRYSTLDTISPFSSLANLQDANWQQNWEKVQYKSTPSLLSPVWFRTEKGDMHLTVLQVSETLEGNSPHLPQDNPIDLLLSDHPGFIFPLDENDIILNVVQFRYKVELRDNIGKPVFELSLDRIITNGSTTESFGVELEILRENDPHEAETVIKLFSVASQLQNEFNLTPSMISKGGIMVPQSYCGPSSIEFDKDEYLPEDSAIVTIVGSSRFLNPESVDNFDVEVWSDTDRGGIDLTVTETNVATRIFEGTAFLTPTDESSGHRIRVTTCDIITVAAEGLSDTAQVSCDMSNEIKFAVIGDYGDDSQQEQAVSNLVKSWNPDFIITAGDNNYPFGAASTIDRNIGKYYHEFIGNYQGSFGEGSLANRFFPSIGNHDWNSPSPTGGDLSPYLDYFTLPGNERYYDFVKGPVHFFAFNSDTREPDGVSIDSIQADWLQTGLSNSESTWNIVFFHHSPYTSGLHSQDAELASLRAIPFREWGANVVLGGHDHDYERLLVDDGSGQIPYFVNGVGGSDIRSFSPSILPESQFQYNEMPGAMLIEANTDCLSFKMFNISNEMIDSYFIGDCPTSSEWWEVLRDNIICVKAPCPCFIAKTAYGSELSMDVQILREVRDNKILKTESGSAFLNGFYPYYYSISPKLVSLEDQNPIFKKMVEIAITPMIKSLLILTYLDVDSETEVLGFGIGIILMNIGMYFVAPAIIIVKIRNKLRKKS